jgi:hypothetical protein
MCPRIFVNLLYAKGMLKQKYGNANIIIFFMPPRYRVHGALKNAKSRKYFYDFFNAGRGNANLNMQCRK